LESVHETGSSPRLGTVYGRRRKRRERDPTATHARKGDFQLTLQRYAAERFLYRLGISPYRDRFVLKGAMLFVL
jgi:hypothetical protein